VEREKRQKLFINFQSDLRPVSESLSSLSLCLHAQAFKSLQKHQISNTTIKTLSSVERKDMGEAERERERERERKEEECWAFHSQKKERERERERIVIYFASIDAPHIN
jgi:hypothetical protein